MLAYFTLRPEAYALNLQQQTPEAWTRTLKATKLKPWKP